MPPAAAAAAFGLAGLLAGGAGSGVAAAVFASGAAACALGVALAAGPRAAARVLCAAGFGTAAGGLLALALAVGTLRASTALPLEQIGRVQGTAMEDSRPSRSGGSIVTIRLERVTHRDGIGSAAARGEARLIVGGSDRVSAGERVAARGRVSRSSQPLEGLVVRASRLERLDAGTGLWRVRARARRAIERAADRFGYPASALFMALFLGDRYGIPEEMRLAFERTGTLHLLALSGLHVGVIYLMAGLLLRPVPVPRVRWAAITAFALAYLWLAGLAPSLVRATLAFVAAGVARLLDRDRRPANVLGLVLLVHVCLAPREAFTAAFQLSYAAVAGLIAGEALLRKRLERFLPPVVATPVAATAGAQLATMPLSLGWFGVWYPVGFVATLAGAPLVALFLSAAVLSLPLVALPLPLAREVVPKALGFLYGLLLQGGRALAGPGAAAALVAGAAAVRVSSRQRDTT